MIPRRSELTSVHVPYRNILIFVCCSTNYRFTRFTRNTRVLRENGAITLASEMNIKVIRRLLGHGINLERNEMTLAF